MCSVSRTVEIRSTDADDSGFHIPIDVPVCYTSRSSERWVGGADDVPYC
jgi:hypothetical protein